MKALAWNVKEQKLNLVEMLEPTVDHADDVKLKVLKVGICGTDREQVHSAHVVPPLGKEAIVLGHEMLGRVVQTGHLVTSVKPGDLAIFTVRRGCIECPACDQGANDMCYTGKYVERGIHGKDGFQSEYVVDREKYLVKVPESLIKSAVLCEPLSIVEKAIEHVMMIQKNRLPNWQKSQNCFERRRVLIAGVGAIGLLAALVFRLRGAEVWGYDIIEENSLRVEILKKMGGNYFNAKEIKPTEILSKVEHLDVIFEAAGNAPLSFDLIHALSANGAYVLTGIPEKGREVKVDGGTLINQMVMKNQVILGSVNAHHSHWVQAIEDLIAAKERWGSLIDNLITHQYSLSEYQTPFFSRDPNEIKTVIGWSD